MMQRIFIALLLISAGSAVAQAAPDQVTALQWPQDATLDKLELAGHAGGHARALTTPVATGLPGVTLWDELRRGTSPSPPRDGGVTVNGRAVR